MAFGEIKGQDRAIAILKGHLNNSRVAGAYLFTGAEAIGKYLAARTFAKALNCSGNKDDSCGTCASCRRIEKNEHPDVHFIDPQDSDAIKIEDIRQLKQNISLRAYEARFKVFVINDAHKLTAEASNALLKILEEPSGSSVIILVTAKPALLFKTVISRCQAVKFFPLERAKLENMLKENYNIEPDPAHFLAYFSEGRIGRCLELNDTDALKDKNTVIDIFTVSRATNLDNLAKQNSKEDIRRYLNTLASWFRDLYLAKLGATPAELINVDRSTEIARSVDSYSWDKLEKIFKCISDSLLYLEQNINVKLTLSNLKAELWKEKS